MAKPAEDADVRRHEAQRQVLRPQLRAAVHGGAKYDLGRNKDLLVIGIDCAHPTCATAKQLSALKKLGCGTMKNANPTVVAVTANKASNPYAFALDFFYQISAIRNGAARG